MDGADDQRARAGLTVAVAQFAPRDDEEANLEAIARFARTAAARGAGLVVFPEYSSCFLEQLGPRLVERAQPLDGPFVAALSDLSRELGIVAVAGLVESAPGTGRFQNTLVAVDPSRGLVATYRKQHLYDAFGVRESDWVLPGALDAPETFEVAGLVVGMQTCYDIRFPEVSRRIVDAGAELILVPAEWVRGPLKEAHWRTLLTARAIENTVYVAAADQTAPGGVGCSMVIDPMGVVLADAGERDGVGVALVEPERIVQVRRTNPALALRRYRVVSG